MLDQWYGIMPNKVLFDKELTDKQKLLFCLISSLCAEKWYCRATNEYLWERLNASKTTISKNVSILQEKWFISVDVSSEEGNKRKIGIVENNNTYCQKWQEGIVKNDNSLYIYKNNINEKEYSFQDFRTEYPHARKWKKKESEKYFNQNDCSSVRKQVHILRRLIKAWLQEWKYVPACERWIRDFTPISPDVVKQDLVKICKRHLNCGWDMKQRATELKQTFGEQEINEIVKAIQQKDSPKNLFLKQN